MWMGGTVPLGYDAIDKKLVINEAEAKTLRTIFAKFVELKSVTSTLRWVRSNDLRTKLRQREGRTVGGAEFHYGALRCVLGNRIYVGEIEHKGKMYQGQQQPIIDREMFDQAQAILASLGSEAMRQPRLVSASLLQGLIVDRHGRTMGPVHTTRKGQRFRYYVTHPTTIREEAAGPYRLAAEALERNCTSLLAEHLAGKVVTIDDDDRAKQLALVLRDGPTEARRAIVVDHVRKIIIGDGELTVELVDGVKLHCSMGRVRHGNDARLIIGELGKINAAKADPQLIILLRDARRAQALALANPALRIDQLATKFGRSSDRFKRLIRLSYLSPSIVTAIIEVRQPVHLTGRFLQHLDGLPHSWSDQEQLLLG